MGQAKQRKQTDPNYGKHYEFVLAFWESHNLHSQYSPFIELPIAILWQHTDFRTRQKAAAVAGAICGFFTLQQMTETEKVLMTEALGEGAIDTLYSLLEEMPALWYCFVRKPNGEWLGDELGERSIFVNHPDAIPADFKDGRWHKFDWRDYLREAV